MNLEVIASRLVNANLGVLGTTLFITEIPTKCLEGTLLMTGYHGTAIDHYLPGYYRGEFRVVTRSSDYVRGLNLARMTLKELTSKEEFTVGTTTFKQILPVTLPRPYRRSVGGYFEFEVDVEAVYVELDS